MTVRRPKLALIMIGIGDLSGGGGAERQFAQAYTEYRRRANPALDVVFVTDPYSYRELQTAHVLAASDDIVVLPGTDWRRSLRLGPLAAVISGHLLRADYDAVHFTLPSMVYLPALMALRFKRDRPATCVTVADCRLAHYLSERPVPKNRAVLGHEAFFGAGRVDGVLAWYELGREMLLKSGIARDALDVHAARYCFSNTERFHPAALKDRHIVFAGRLSDVKKPLWFVEAVRLIRSRGELPDWRFSIYGKGELAAEVESAIAAAGLRDELTVAHSADMSTIFPSTSVFVSTQEYENFTSLSMLEAMAAGNAVVARNVGQTSYFVQDGRNGVLAAIDSPAGIADAIVECTRDEERLTRMQHESRSIATQTHTIANFLDEVETFWIHTLALHRARNGARAT